VDEADVQVAASSASVLRWSSCCNWQLADCDLTASRSREKILVITKRQRRAKNFGRRLCRRFWTIAKPYWFLDAKWTARGMLVLLVLLLLGRTEFTVLFSQQSGEFTSALAARDTPRFWHTSLRPIRRSTTPTSESPTTSTPLPRNHCVLWGISKTMVVFLVVYALIGTAATFGIFGKPLVGLNFQQCCARPTATPWSNERCIEARLAQLLRSPRADPGL